MSEPTTTVVADGDDDVDVQGEDLEAAAPPAREGILRDRPRLVALTFLMLFSQLALIRWLGAEVFYLSYFSNFVLLGSFLGIGLGFLWAGRGGRPLYPFAPLLLGGLILYVQLFPVPLEVKTEGLIFFDTIEPKSAIPRELVLVILFLAVAAVMAAIGDGVARTFGRFEPLDAYRLDLVGSVAGIASFTVLSFLGRPAHRVGPGDRGGVRADGAAPALLAAGGGHGGGGGAAGPLRHGGDPRRRGLVAVLPDPVRGERDRRHQHDGEPEPPLGADPHRGQPAVRERVPQRHRRPRAAGAR